jgi:hypothetical protein
LVSVEERSQPVNVCQNVRKESQLAQNPSVLKRQKELARLEWRQKKLDKRKQRKLEKDGPAHPGEPNPAETAQPDESGAGVVPA